MYIIAGFLLSCLTTCAYASERPIFLTRMADGLATGIIGGISGTLATVAYAPFHYMQNQLAQKSKIEGNIPNILRNCLRGCSLLAAVNIPTITFEALVLNAAYKAMNCSDNKEPNWKKTFAAILAGCASSPITNASQLVVLHKQNTGASVRQIINGFPDSHRSLTRGIVPIALQRVFFVTAYTNGLSYMNNEVAKHCRHNTIAFVSSAFLSAALLTATTQPLKIMAAKLHADIEKKQYKGAADLLKQLINLHGFKIIKLLWIGWEHRTIGNGFSLGVLYLSQNQLNKLKGEFV
jgi:hypothetical protein